MQHNVFEYILILNMQHRIKNFRYMRFGILYIDINDFKIWS